MHQKLKLAFLSEEYEEEDSDFSFDNNQKSSVIPTVKKLWLVEMLKEDTIIRLRRRKQLIYSQNARSL
jgi:hypothetical protein